MTVTSIWSKSLSLGKLSLSPGGRHANGTHLPFASSNGWNCVSTYVERASKITNRQLEMLLEKSIGDDGIVARALAKLNEVFAVYGGGRATAGISITTL